MKNEQIEDLKKIDNNNMPGSIYIKSPFTTKKKPSTNERISNPLISSKKRINIFNEKGQSRSPCINKKIISINGQLCKDQNKNKHSEIKRNKSDNTWKKYDNNKNYNNIQNTKK
jgi:hypothetical protein